MGNVHDRLAADAGDRPAADAGDRPAADAGDRSFHLLHRVPADESESHNCAGADTRDPSLSLRLHLAAAEKAEAHDRRDVADRAASASFPHLRRDPGEEAEARDRRDADAIDCSAYLPPRCPAEDSPTHDRADADAGAPSSSLRLRRAPAVDDKADEPGPCRRENRIVGDKHHPVKPAAACDTGAQRRGRQEKGIGGDTYLPSNLAAEAGEHCGGRWENSVVPDRPHPNAQQYSLNQLPGNNIQVETSDIGLGSQYIDPNHVYDLYRQGQLKSLLNYMDSFPGAANDPYYQIIKELIYISMRVDVPTHLEFEWNAKRAESARDLAGRIGRSSGSLQESLTSRQALICSDEPCQPCQRPSDSMSIHDTTLKNSNDGQVMQKIPMVSGLLDRHGCPIPDIEGINPLRFHSRHPVWGEHALAVEKSKDTKVGSFFCMYCEKELVGNATEAIRHMKKGCKIPLHTLKNLLEEVDQYKERAEQLRRAHKDSKTKGRKVRKANDDLAIQKRDAVEIAELVLELSQSKKYGPLDDTTGVMAMIQTLLMQAQIHLSYGIEIIEIAGYFEMASRIALHHLDHISENVIFSSTDRESLVSTCMAVLSMNSYELALANVAVEAVLEVADTEKKEVRLELIQVKGRIGRTQSVELVHGIVIDKHISHKQMPKRIEGAKIAFLSFEPSNINTVETSRILHEEQHKYVEEMIRKCEDIGATLVICQWRFDEEVSQLLMQRKLTAVSGVSDAELKEIANATGGHIVQKIQDLSLDKLGEAKLFREKKIGKTKGRVLYIESYASPTPVTIFFHAGSNIILEEKMRNLADALRVLRSLITDNSFVCGGGSAEISCSLALDAAADTYPGYARPFLKSFAHALDAIPLAVAENSGLLPFDTLTMLKSRHIKENNAYFGIDCNRHGIYNMKEQHVFASLSGKKKQILLALKVMRTVLKADEVT